jgi:hypothetical protein
VPGGYTLPQGGSPSSFDNVYACGPANNTKSQSNGYEVPASGPYQGFFENEGWTYQCVELANRFAFDIWGLRPVHTNGDDYASALSSQDGVTLVPNGTNGQPYLPGDIVSFTGTGSLADGHVAVVMWSTYSPGDGGNYSVTLLQQNASANGTASATVTNWSMGDPSGSKVTPSNFDALAAYMGPSHLAVFGGDGSATLAAEVAAGTSPSITAVANGYEVAYQVAGGDSLGGPMR